MRIAELEEVQMQRVRRLWLGSQNRTGAGDLAVDPLRQNPQVSRGFQEISHYFF
jgi:hypothetical protein